MLNSINPQSGPAVAYEECHLTGGIVLYRSREP